MTNYWSCSKFADWIRGVKKPHSGTSDDWRRWTRESKKFSKFRYWLAEDGLDLLQDIVDFIPKKINGIRCYLNNRFMTRTNSLTASKEFIKPGEWCDVGDRFLPCLFSELVNFVEVEQAWMHVICDDNAAEKFNMPAWRQKWWARWFKEWRCPAAGLAHLDWEASLTVDSAWVDETHPEFGKPTHQAIAAKEIKELYLWWTVTRPMRPDPHEESGWGAICRKNRSAQDDDEFEILQVPANSTESRNAINRLREIENTYEKEDEEMMIRLIRVRNSLWT